MRRKRRRRDGQHVAVRLTSGPLITSQGADCLAGCWISAKSVAAYFFSCSLSFYFFFFLFAVYFFYYYFFVNVDMSQLRCDKLQRRHIFFINIKKALHFLPCKIIIKTGGKKKKYVQNSFISCLVNSNLRKRITHMLTRPYLFQNGPRWYSIN